MPTSEAANVDAPCGASVMTAHGPLTFNGRCLLMGVLNVTPDSFSGDGVYDDVGTAVAQGLAMAEQGADVIDIGGESTRPGSDPVSAAEQIRRVIPVIEELRQRGLAKPISVDTQLADVARAALTAGADIVNDVSAARCDPTMPQLLAETRAPFVAMHMQGTPATMQLNPTYADVVEEIRTFFQQRAEALTAIGIDVARRMIVDPGLGFGKTAAHNLTLMQCLERLKGRWPLLVGPSRKAFIGGITGEDDPRCRLVGTATAVARCALAGAAMVRVHDVKAMRQVVDMCAAIRGN